MSDQSTAPSKFTFTEQELLRFYRAKWKIQTCEVCEVNAWGTDSINTVSYIPASDGTAVSILTDTMTVHLRIQCQNCGNTKFLLAAVIRRWLDANP